jgi:aspartate 1-decarboxylase
MIGKSNYHTIVVTTANLKYIDTDFIDKCVLVVEEA